MSAEQLFWLVVLLLCFTAIGTYIDNRTSKNGDTEESVDEEQPPNYSGPGTT